jgi:hypothetical protein
MLLKAKEECIVLIYIRVEPDTCYISNLSWVISECWTVYKWEDSQNYLILCVYVMLYDFELRCDVKFINILVLFKAQCDYSHSPNAQQYVGKRFPIVTVWRSYSCELSDLNQQIKLFNRILIWTVRSKSNDCDW